MGTSGNCGLFFGSFNPIHIGHLAIANFMVESTGLSEIWFVVSPHNPLKNKSSLLNGYQRLEMVHIAIGNDPRFRASDIEFHLPKPSYTSETLAYLKEKYPKKEFALIIGGDNLKNFHKWKNHEFIIEQYKRYVYPRPGEPIDPKKHKNIELVDSPLMEISSSFIRKNIKEGKRLNHFLPEKVWDYIDKMNFYR